jgi:hypothetical protein
MLRVCISLTLWQELLAPPVCQLSFAHVQFRYVPMFQPRQSTNLLLHRCSFWPWCKQRALYLYSLSNYVLNPVPIQEDHHLHSLSEPPRDSGFFFDSAGFPNFMVGRSQIEDAVSSICWLSAVRLQYKGTLHTLPHLKRPLNMYAGECNWYQRLSQRLS